MFKEILAWLDTPAKNSDQPYYQLVEACRNSKNENLIVAKHLGTIRGTFKLSAIDLVTKHKEILSKFSIEDIVNIVGLAASSHEPKQIQTTRNTYTLFAPLAMLFITLLVVSNIIATKLVSLFGFTMPAGLLSIAVFYFVGDIITEVYGYKRTRQLIWCTISCQILASLLMSAAIYMPAADIWHHQTAFQAIFSTSSRVVFASLIAYATGEFINSYILAKMKLAYLGEKTWLRFACSTVVGVIIDNTLFVTLSYAFTVPLHELLPLIVHMTFYKIVIQAAVLPITLLVTKKVKAIENTDTFDFNTDFTPFSLNVDYSNQAHTASKVVYLDAVRKQKKR